MTKKELNQLHSEKCMVQPVKWQSGRGEEQRYLVSFSLTRGELIVLYTIVDSAPQNEGDSFFKHIKNDIKAFVKNALYRAGLKL